MFNLLILRLIYWFFGLFNPFLRIYDIHNAPFSPVRILQPHPQLSYFTPSGFFTFHFPLSIAPSSLPARILYPSFIFRSTFFIFHSSPLVQVSRLECHILASPDATFHFSFFILNSQFRLTTDD